MTGSLGSGAPGAAGSLAAAEPPWLAVNFMIKDAVAGLVPHLGSAEADDLLWQLGLAWPPGTIVIDTGDPAVAWPGWELCRGGLLGQVAEAALFGAIGHVFGGDPGGGNFRLPDFRACIPLGPGTGKVLGAKGGARGHVHAAGGLTAEHSHPNGSLSIPAHAHGHSLSMNYHEHSCAESVKVLIAGNDGFQRRNFAGATQGPNVNTIGGGVSNDGPHAPGGTAGGASVTAVGGSSGAADPPVLVVNFRIKK